MNVTYKTYKAFMYVCMYQQQLMMYVLYVFMVTAIVDWMRVKCTVKCILIMYTLWKMMDLVLLHVSRSSGFQSRYGGGGKGGGGGGFICIQRYYRRTQGACG